MRVAETHHFGPEIPRQYARVARSGQLAGHTSGNEWLMAIPTVPATAHEYRSLETVLARVVA